ncbi:very short patch repair endonuclease [Methylobacterium sp. J-070]|uniref:very short patch repair endonuclease n=1 Tax=Methylobacterium sp. J-070 TaxID=2836650 RepID=UPI001FBA4124|nr:DNA mismatch endonuclease Vsr [Methylobacterium sp. J-070]MCJ2050288.1 DNA mismatch endonuclease Vsr [Methylobacterium sp. J-070]
MDRWSPEDRSALMARVRNRDTSPELAVRKLAHAQGLRFRVNRRDLPGTPDLVFPRYRLAVFVHGCFWHRHSGCKRATTPKTRQDFWEAKLVRNVERDQQAAAALEGLGWQVMTVWECELKDQASVAQRLLASTRGLPPLSTSVDYG